MQGALPLGLGTTVTPRNRPRRNALRRVFDTARGFTLIELLVVVAMVGILAALALVGYRKYIRSAQSSEATAMLQAIRSAEEGFKAEALTYQPCSSVTNAGALQGAELYPRVQTALDDAKASWEMSSHANYARWKLLNAKSDGPVRFGYGVLTGLPGGTLPSGAVAGAPSPAWANAFGGSAPSDPWFVASAVGDRDDDNTSFAVFQTASFVTEVIVYEDTE